MEKLSLFFVFISLLVHHTWAAGAGRAFPIEAENFAIESFKRANPRIEWDPTNFLVDLSGEYANCNYLNQKGEVQVSRKTPEGAPVVMVVDSVQGKEADVNSVNEYIREIIKRWSTSGTYNRQINDNKRIGCSVRPACSGYAVIACAFSTGVPDARPQPTLRPPPIVYYTTQRPYDLKTQWDEPKRPGFLEEKPKALAFTPDQYKLAEEMMGKHWDRAHFLENLSGFETDCSMIGRRDWPFDYAKKMERELNMKITGQYGYTVNKGSTPDALREILRGFKPVQNAKEIGCSVIPHCRTTGDTMQVVVACLYEEL